METFLIRALQLILSLSLLVVVHEMGHFLFARLFKVRVEKFSLFFDPWFSLFKFKPKNSDTEYSIGWLPLGGYVKISGMIDESMDKAQMALPAQPYEFRSKPAGQRLLIMIGGVVFNFVLALFIYSMILFAWGDRFTPLNKVSQGMVFSEAAKASGFKDGDILLTADDVPLERMGEKMLLQIAESREVKVLRGQQVTSVYIPEEFMTRLMAGKEGFCYYLYPTIINQVAKGSLAEKAGLKANDRITAINGDTIISYFDYKTKMVASKNKEVVLGYTRYGLHVSTTAKLDTTATLGFVAKDYTEIYPQEIKTFTFFESFPAGIALGIQTLKGYVGQFKYVFTKEGASSLGGFGTIGSIFPAQWDWQKFWSMTAFLSIILAFMNILPIPALDGGHVVFLLYEIVARRKPSDKFMEYTQITGMILLFGLLLFANLNDIIRFFF